MDDMAIVEDRFAELTKSELTSSVMDIFNAADVGGASSTGIAMSTTLDVVQLVTEGSV